jgi:YVTN family beta-propeller protein
MLLWAVAFLAGCGSIADPYNKAYNQLRSAMGVASPASASSPDPSYVLAPIINSDQRLEFPGMSVFPPRGENWFVATVPAEFRPATATNLIWFAKKLGTKDGQPNPQQTILASALIYDLHDKRFETSEAFVEFMRQSMVGEVQEGPRFRILKSDISLDRTLGAKCVKYNISCEDTSNPRHPGPVLILSLQGFRCLHPHWPRFAIDVGYSQRAPQGEQYISVEAEVRPFLRSLVFTKERPLSVTMIGAGTGPEMVAVGEGSVWVTQINDNTVARIDPQTNNVVATIPVGRDPVGIVIARQAVWVANGSDGTVSRIDPRTNKVVTTIHIGGSPQLLAYGEEAIWTTNRKNGTVSRIDPDTNQVIGDPIPVLRQPSGIAVSSGAVWVTDYEDGTVIEIDPKTNQFTGSPIHVGRGPGFAVAGDGAVWVANQTDATVTRIDPRTRSVVATIPVGRRASGLAIDKDTIWVTNYADDTVSRIDPRTNAVIGIPIPVGKRPLGVAFGANAVWVANLYGDSISRIDR